MDAQQTIRHIAIDMATRFNGKGQDFEVAISNARKIATFIQGDEATAAPAPEPAHVAEQSPPQASPA